MSRYVNCKNIVLIGMSGAGKTVVGKYIANRLNMEFIDSDDMIISHTGKTIDYIFNRYGEEYFRSLEKEIIKNISSRKGTVISTGGGVILDNENVELLKRNGIIFLLKASINTIVSNLKSSPSYQESRPLLKDSLSLRNRILEIYREREKLYLSSANMIVNVDGISIEKIGEEIIYVYKNLNPCSCNKSLI